LFCVHSPKMCQLAPIRKPETVYSQPHRQNVTLTKPLDG